MSWKPQVFKSGWQHRDPAIRAAAVAQDDDPELLAQLARICEEDEDARVRGAAAQRVEDIGTLLQAHSREQDPAAREALQARLRVLGASSAPERPAIEDRLRLVADTEDRELLEAVAEHAPEPELRIAALGRISRQGFLGDRAIRDADAEVRRTAAAGITRRSTLQRVIEATRGTDKTLHQALERRLYQELLAAGDPQAVAREALAICEALEDAALHGASAGDAGVAARRVAWVALAGPVPTDLQSRYQRALERFTTGAVAGEPAPPAVTEPAPPSTRPAAPPTEPAAETETPAEDHDALQAAFDAFMAGAAEVAAKPSARRLKGLQRQWQSAWNALAAPGEPEQNLAGQVESRLAELQGMLREQQEQQQAQLDAATSLVERLAQELEEGALHQALESRAKLQELAEVLASDQRWHAIKARMATMQGRLRELRDWQHWSNNKIRKRMIEEMRVLPEADLHPDAVLARIKELQSRWKELEESEQIPGERHFSAAPWMWRKFSAGGQRAFEATKPFLDKRDEIRTKHLAETKALVAEARDLIASEAPDWQALNRALRRARKALRSLDEVPAKARKGLAAKLKRALSDGQARMQEHYEEVEKVKRRLIREAAQLAHLDDRAEAIGRAKSLQSEWKAAGSLWRSRENQLWAEFRKPIDPLFAALKAEDASRQAERSAERDAQRALCAELEALLELPDAELTEHEGKARGLEDAWADAGKPDPALRKRFQGRVRQLESRLAAHRRTLAQARRAQRWELAELVRRAETAQRSNKLTDPLKKKLTRSLPDVPGDDALVSALLARFQCALDGQAPEAPDHDAPETGTRAQRICIALEYLAGKPSPPAEKDARMQYQVERLSASMSGELQRESASTEARRLEREWLALPYFEEPPYDALQKRVRDALEALQNK